ncbi:hypothetical protein RYH73_12185 [Olivibacter sp. CPCC 100613]|uniref:hypothetical protein n=1 Tax=Olivibacter sp. CPCC 100613 TaxID=3079931 RepID=UPI002FF4C1DA
MEKKEILVICTNPAILSTILRLINKESNWNATGIDNVQEACLMRKTRPLDLVLMGAGLSPEEEDQLIKELAPINCIRHYGGGSGLLYAEILSVLPNS